MRELRHAVGLRALSSGATSNAVKETKTALPSFKQYREKDGLFYFKFVDAKGGVLLQSEGFASPKEAGQAMARLQAEGLEGWPSTAPERPALSAQAMRLVHENLLLLSTFAPNKAK
jgi:tryptophanyl-tRNA synthetase